MALFGRPRAAKSSSIPKFWKIAQLFFFSLLFRVLVNSNDSFAWVELGGPEKLTYILIPGTARNKNPLVPEQAGSSPHEALICFKKRGAFWDESFT